MSDTAATAVAALLSATTIAAQVAMLGWLDRGEQMKHADFWRDIAERRAALKDARHRDYALAMAAYHERKARQWWAWPWIAMPPEVR